MISAAAGSAFLHGYNLGVTNPPERVLRSFLNSTLTQANSGIEADEAMITNAFAVVVSALCVGGLVGAMLVAPISQRFGRRGGLLFNSMFAIVGATCIVLARRARSHELLIIGRALVGIHAGES